MILDRFEQNLATVKSSITQINNAVTYASDAASDALSAIQRLDWIDYYMGLNNGNCYIQTGSGKVYITSSGAGIQNVSGGGHIYVGFAGNAANGPIDTSSDKRLKTDINNDLADFKKLFFNLKPITFKYKNNLNKRYIGFIAQELETTVQNEKLDKTKDFMPVLEMKTENFKDQKFVCYNDFIGLNTYMLQEAYKEIDQLKQEIKELKEQINK